jgi:homoserine O-succinyltransferase/O-acetyltransferase
MIDGPVAALWQEDGKSRRVGSMDGSSTNGRPVDRHLPRSHGVSLALINNMPDAALKDTEAQFFDLLDAASGDIPVFLKLYSLPGVPRADRGLRHLNGFYFKFDELWRSHFDGVIITGTEPRQPDLRDEPYWPLLTEVFDWAAQNTASAVLSCLAAHAGVLHGDGVRRHRLPDKQFGVFQAHNTGEHALTRNSAGLVHFPHSRWNEVREEELIEAGYSILTKSPQAGVDLFVKKKKRSLFVHFQGHPEYGARTLLKEYRRDVKRFLHGERETYPALPHGYFDAAAAGVLKNFRKLAEADRREEIISSFPEAVVEGLQNNWHSSAVCVYRNWLQYVASNQTESPVFSMTTALAGEPAKRSVAP